MTTPRPPLTRIHLLAVILALLIALNGASLNLFSSLDHALSDVFVRKVAATLLPDPDIVIVDIDEKSITAMQDVAGSWPWPRAVHGELLEGIAKQKPAAIVFDLLFSEPDRYRPESDQMFNDTLRDMHNVYLPMLQMEGDQSTGVPLAELAKVTDIPHRADADPNARAILLAPQAVDPKSWRVGLINFSEDKKDGIGRRYDVRRNIGGWYLESLPARLMRDLGVKVPEQDDIILHWRGGNSPYKHISYSDLYADQSREHPVRDAHELSGKIVIIGSSATGLHDIRATPISSLYSGTEILATAIDDLKNQRHTRAPPAFLAPLLAMLLMLLQLPLFARRMDASRIGAILLATSMTLLALQYFAMTRMLSLDLFTPLLFGWLFYFGAALSEYLREKRSREQTIRMFNRFLDPRVVESLVAQGETPQSLSGQARDITVLFSDIRGFTTMSESHTPEQIVALLNRYFSLQVEIIFRHGGTLDKFIGDAIMAFWGAPQEDPQHAAHAVAAAIEMEACLLKFKEELGEEGKDFDVGIGIHSGKAVVGFIGSNERMDYTAIGDTVNLSSRIEGLTKGVARILVSSDTVERCGEAFDFTPTGSYKVKGRNQEVELYFPKVRS
jgi:adenylate cyclase